MNREDVLGALSVLKAAYPAFYSKMNQRDAERIVALWCVMFEKDDEEVVTWALYDLISTHSGYPPDIADIKARIREVTDMVTGCGTDVDLWNELCDMAENHSSYPADAQKAFEKASPIIQRWLCSPSRLHDLGMLDRETFQTVTRGQFMKAIPAMRRRVEFAAALPESIKAKAPLLSNAVDFPRIGTQEENQE